MRYTPPQAEQEKASVGQQCLHTDGGLSGDFIRCNNETRYDDPALALKKKKKKSLGERVKAHLSKRQHKDLDNVLMME